MENQTLNRSEETEFYRFQVVSGDRKENPLEKTKTVGMAYMRKGQSLFTLRLWMLLNDRFYLVPSKHDPAKYLVMTREPNKSLTAKNKYFWNIVGNAAADSTAGHIRVDFDLLDKPVYMSIHPEPAARSVRMAEPVGLDEAA